MVIKTNQTPTPKGKFYPLMESFGRVHAYLIDDGEGLTVIDSLRDKGGKVIFEALQSLGRSPKDVRRIILTHAHPTHVNGAAALKAASGAPIYAPAPELEVFEGRRPCNPTTWVPKRPLRLLPQQFLLNLQNFLWVRGSRPAWLNVQPVKVDHIIEKDDQYIGELITFRTPGHSPGSTSFYWPQTGTLFAGDIVVTWPIFEPGWKGLTENYPQNLAALQRLVTIFEGRGWQIRHFAAGHGAPLATEDGLADIKRLLAEAQRAGYTIPALQTPAS
jgi:glyoxylase-like metal-dependent hydrolase (beta-lactamase superfamily II)